jgi:tetratricopeptide (TPR) repeat protein
LRHPHYLAFAALARAVRALWRGDVHSAERLIGEAHAAGARSEPDFADQARAAQTLQLLRLRGQEKALAPAIREGAARFPMIATYRCALAAIELEVGRPEEAAALLHDLVDSGEDGGPLRPGEPNWDLNVALLAEVAAVVGEPRIAERILQALAPRRGRYLHVPNLVAAGCASHAIGLMAARLSRWDDAVEAFEEALVLERRLEAVPRIALVEAELSRALRRRGAAGDDEAAAGCAARAEEIAARPGLEGILSKVRAATAGESP